MFLSLQTASVTGLVNNNQKKQSKGKRLTIGILARQLSINLHDLYIVLNFFFI